MLPLGVSDNFFISHIITAPLRHRVPRWSWSPLLDQATGVLPATPLIRAPLSGHIYTYQLTKAPSPMIIISHGELGFLHMNGGRDRIQAIAASPQLRKFSF